MSAPEPEPIELDVDQEPAGGRRRSDGKWSSLYSTSAGFPLAVKLGRLPEILKRPPAEIEQAAAKITPYTHADGSPRYSVREVRAVLAGRRLRRREHVRTREE